jgi:SlyX protein
MSQAPQFPSESDPAGPHASLSKVDQRLTELEIKAAFTEDLLDELNQTIVRQQQQIDLLVRELLQLRDQADAAQPTFRSLRDELPPHY